MFRHRFAPPALALALVLGCAAAASAQTEGRVSVGGSIAFNNTPDGDLTNGLSVGPLVRLNPTRGWRPAGALNWFRADLANPAGGDDAFARLHVRPLMGGIGYTFGPDRTLFNISVVAGPSFNSADFDDDFLDRTLGTPTIEAKTSFAIRPGFSVTQTLAPRVGLVGFAGYLINRPEITYRSVTGQQVDDRWRADSAVLSVGLVYSLF